MIPLEWLEQAPDSMGECDHCHKDAALWMEPACEGDWQYCAACVRAMHKARKQQRKDDAAETWRTGNPCDI
jgi:hypothetical protein